MDRYRLDFLGLCEVRWKGSGEFRTATGHHFLFSGNQNSHINGVGLLLTDRMKKALMEYRPISERIMAVRIRTKYRNLTVIQCYAPTEAADNEIKNAFYEQLNSVIANTPKSDIKIVMGDLNAKVGSDNTNLCTIMGTEGLGNICNDNGERLLDFCTGNQLFIGGTKFPHRDIHKYTWQSPDGFTRNQIDHIMISRKFLGCLLDVKTIRGADIYSDHQLLVGIIRLRPMANYRHSCARKKFNVHRLQQPTVADVFSDRLNAELEHLQQPSWKNINEACIKTAHNTLGTSRHHTTPWIRDATWEKINERKQTKAELLAASSDAQARQIREHYNEIERQVKRMARSDRRLYFKDIARAAESAAALGKTRETYVAIKKMSGTKLSTTPNIKDNDGIILTSTDAQLERWREFFESAPTIPEEFTPFSGQSRRNPRRDINTSPPTLAEIKSAISKLKNDKAAGTDMLPPEIFKATPILANYIWSQIKEAWTSCRFPSEWKEGVIITLPKKGDLSECRNWRGITLLNTIQKIVALVILDRISPTIESALRNEQSGFRPNRSCVDHINTLRIIVEQSAEFNSPIFLTFVDFERAFDTINRDAIWSALHNIGIPDQIISLIKEIYRDAPCKARFKGQDSRPFYINTGVRQGCTLSPVLFLTVLDTVLQQTNTEAPAGIQWHLNQRLHDLDYADDICLMSHTLEGLQKKLDSLYENGRRVGLKINLAKTKSMRLGTANFTPLVINGVAIEDVNRFTYLGSIISTDGGADADVTNRINKARCAYATLSKVWNSSQISKRHKINIFNSSVKSVLLYGCETWKVTDPITSKLQVFINKCLRKINRIFWPSRITNIDLLTISNQKPISQEIRQRKWTWIGHTLRKNINDIAKTSLQWNPQGRRNVGRQRTTWRRSVEAEHRSRGLSWPQIRHMAQNRTSWRVFVDSLQ